MIFQVLLAIALSLLPTTTTTTHEEISASEVSEPANAIEISRVSKKKKNMKIIF